MLDRATDRAELFLMATVTASAGAATDPGPTASDCTATTLTIDAVTWPASAAVRPTETGAFVVTATVGTVCETFPPPGAGTGVVRAGLADVPGAEGVSNAEFAADEATAVDTPAALVEDRPADVPAVAVVVVATAGDELGAGALAAGLAVPDAEEVQAARASTAPAAIAATDDRRTLRLIGLLGRR